MSTGPGATSSPVHPSQPASATEAGVVRVVASVTHPWIVLAVGPRGEMVETNALRDPEADSPLRLRLVSRDGTTTPIDLSERAPAYSQITGVTLNDRYVVWSATSGTQIESQPEVIFAYDRRLKQTTRIFARGTRTPAPGYTSPQVSGHGVYVVESAHPGDFGIYYIPISGSSPPRLIAKNSAFAATSVNELFYAQANPAGNVVSLVESGSSPRRVVHRVTLGSRYTSVAGLAVHGDWVAWILHGSHGQADLLTAMNTRTGQIFTSPGASPSECLSNPSISNTFVVWSNGACSAQPRLGSYLMNLATGAVYVLGPTQGLYGTWAGGDYVAWQTATGQGPFDVTVLLGSVHGN